MNYKNLVVISLLLSCNTDVDSALESNSSYNKVPLSIAQNFSLIYSDSTILKSLITGEKHYDFSNDELNYSISLRMSTEMTLRVTQKFLRR